MLIIMRQAGGYSKRKKPLEQIYIDPEYQLYTQLTDQITLSELSAKAVKIEESSDGTTQIRLDQQAHRRYGNI